MRKNKLYCIMIIVVMIFSFSACSTKEASESNVPKHSGLPGKIDLKFISDKQKVIWFRLAGSYDSNFEMYDFPYYADVKGIFYWDRKDDGSVEMIHYENKTPNEHLGTLDNYNDCETFDEIIEKAESQKGCTKYVDEQGGFFEYHLDDSSGRYLEDFTIRLKGDPSYHEDESNDAGLEKGKFKINATEEIGPYPKQNYCYGGFVDSSTNEIIVTRCNEDAEVILQDSAENQGID